MGRTQRTRIRRNRHQRAEALDHEEAIINLRKFMARHGFIDKLHLHLRNFPLTGRGVSTRTDIQENDILITIPYDLMITYSKLKSTGLLKLFMPKSKLLIHDLLAAFLVFEKHKPNSFWSDYIKSLPSKPPWLPALVSDDGIELLPPDLRLETLKSRRRLQESWSRLRKSMRNDWTCECCGQKADCVIEPHSFTWGYILVNTRAVYVDPALVRGSDDWSGDVLSDEPSMALCPFLDMFNHSPHAKTNAELIRHEGHFFYQLTTSTASKKYEQVFISYGDHTNERLLTEYGFFVPGNHHDCIIFHHDRVFKLLALNLDDGQYKFIVKHGLNKSLWFGEFGASFNLKALLFVAFSNTDVKNWTKTVFSNKYSNDFLGDIVTEMCAKLLDSECERNKEILKSMLNTSMQTLVIDFLKYKQELTEKFWLQNNKFNLQE